MNNSKKRILSYLLTGALTLSSLAPLATAADFEVGEAYVNALSEEAKAETERLYEQRPVVLRQMEALNRGVVAVKSNEGTLVSWRMLGTDDADIAFNVYRDGVKLNSAPIDTKTNYLDKDATASAAYSVVPVIDGKEVSEEKELTTSLDNPYLSIPVRQIDALGADGKSLGVYDINDVSVGDLDGDGQYEVVVRRNPPSMDIKVRNGNYPLIEAYKLDGTHLWTINIGPNEINDVDINFLVYDFNQDGKAEMVTRSFEGTIDGVGTQIGDVDGDGKTNYEDSIVAFPDRQYLSKGPEFLSIYDGMTGKEIDRTNLLPARDPLSSWSANYTDGRLVKRASHYTFTVAYLDGVTPAIVHTRGAWDTVKLAAWDIKSNKFNHLWTLDCESSSTLDNLWNTGYHSVAVADIDFDGKDEVLSGSYAVDNDGSLMYATKAKDASGNWVKLGHGDAFDVAKMNPDDNAYYIWSCQENKNLPVNIGMHDARTGQVLFGYTKPKDTGRSRAADIDPTSKGWEVWGSTGTPLQSFDGTILNPVWNAFQYKNADGSNMVGADGSNVVGSIPMSFKAYWDGDLLCELVDGVTISKWDWENQTINTILTDSECTPLGGTKAQPCLIADVFGDWREEVIFRTTDNTELRIYTTNIPTEYKMPTLMHDLTYREAVAWQNNHYNQPTNTSFYFGAETTKVPVPTIYTMKNGVKKVNAVYQNNANTHATMPILMESKQVASNAVVLKIGSSNALNGDAIVAIDSENASVTPIIADGGRTMVPLRFLSETFGAEVAWDGDTRTVTLTKGNDVITMVIDQNSYTVNGEAKGLDVPAQIMNDRTMVPLRAVLESFGKQLFWDDRGIIAIGDVAPTPDETTITDWISKL